MSQKKREDNPGVFVRVDDCREKHGKIDLALFGEDGRGGIVKDISDIKGDLRIVKEKVKGSLSGKDKAAIIGALLMAVASIIVALLK